MAADSLGPVRSPGSEDARLDSWKEIAAYLGRHVTTVRRWEKTEGLPVHRHVHEKLGSVYAFRAELDAWWRSRRAQLEPPQEHVTEVAAEAAATDRADWPAPKTAHADVTPGRALLSSRRLLVGGAIALCGIAVAYAMALGWKTDARRADITSLAVLPLENLSADPAQEYFADGITEAISGQLAQLRDLRVVSRTSVMVFKHSRKPMPDIAKALGVDAVVLGSVQRSGDRVRIGVRLIDGRTDTHLWARDYERDWKDILKLQAELAQAVAEEVRIQVTPEERARIASTASVIPAAHQEYLIGRYHMWRDDEENLQRAIAHFERAAQIDPQYAAAYASLAHAWWKRGMWGKLGLSATESPARAAARKALELDRAIPDAYVVQADLERLYDRDLVGAEELVRRALALNPHHVDAHYTYALLLMTLGRFPAAIEHMETAERLDPLSPAIQSDFGRVLYRARRYEDAIVHLNRALELEPAIGGIVHPRLGEVYEQMGQYDRAVAALRQPGHANRSAQARLARVLARMGRHREAKRLLATLEAEAGQLPLNEVAAVYVALGDHDKAFTLLYEMVERGDPGPNFVAVDPPFDDLHSDPRWAELVRKVNLPRQTRPSGV